MSFLDANTAEAGNLRRTRVVFLTDIPTPYVVAILKELATHVDLTCLFSSDQSTRGMNWQLGNELTFRHQFVGGLVSRRKDSNGIDAYISPRVLWRLCQARPAAIISAGFSFPTMYALIYSWLTGARLLVYSDGTSFSERNYGKMKRLARAVLVPRVHALIAKSRLAAERFRELGGGSKIFIAHHTTNLAPFLDVGFTREVAPPSGPLKLISVGRLIPRKGVALLLNALSRLKSSPRPVHLTLVGSGSEEDELKSLSQRLGLDNVTFAGFADQSHLPNYYRDAHAFVMPTLQDPFGIVLLEAAASGLALVSSVHAGATHELVTEGMSGFVVDPIHETSMVRAIEALAGSAELVMSMGRAAHQEAQQRTPHHTVASYLEALRFALKSDRFNW